MGFEHDYHAVDITDEKAFDTDLEIEGNASFCFVVILVKYMS